MTDRRIVVAQLIHDDREVLRDYGSPRPVFGTAPGALVEGFTGLDGVEVHIISCLQQPVAAPEKLASNIFYHALHVPKIGWLRTGYQGCIRAVRRKLRELRPDVVHGQGTERDCAMTAVFSGFPNVLTIHGNMRSVARQVRARPFTFAWLTALLEGFALPRSDGVLCNSAYTENEVKSLARRVWRVPNALLPDYFSPLPAPAGPGGVPRLLVVATVLPYKRQVEILEMARRLHEGGAQFEILFIGKVTPTPYGAEFSARVAQAEALGFARYLGTKTTAEVVQLMDSASALVHVPTEEAFGLVVAEGLARNLKLFGARCGGVTDIASGVEGAELFDPNDWEGLAQAIERWLKSGCPRPVNAASLMRPRYHPGTIARRHIEIYRELLASLPKSRVRA